MREIKFRGKCITPWGEPCAWHFGNLLTTQDAEGKRAVYIVEGGDYYLVDPDTVGEYTGFTDCKNVDIYEGDVLGFDVSRWLVSYQTGSFLLLRISSASDFGAIRTFADYFVRREAHVIGNIFDEPSFLSNFKKLCNERYAKERAQERAAQEAYERRLAKRHNKQGGNS